MATLNTPEANEQNAKLKMSLRAKSGYSCEATHQVSANQWATICVAAAHPDRAHIMDAAPELLAICMEFVRRVDAGEVRSKRTYAAMKAAIAKAGAA